MNFDFFCLIVKCTCVVHIYFTFTNLQMITCASKIQSVEIVEILLLLHDALDSSEERIASVKA